MLFQGTGSTELSLNLSCIRAGDVLLLTSLQEQIEELKPITEPLLLRVHRYHTEQQVLMRLQNKEQYEAAVIIQARWREFTARKIAARLEAEAS